MKIENGLHYFNSNVANSLRDRILTRVDQKVIRVVVAAFCLIAVACIYLYFSLKKVKMKIKVGPEGKDAVYEGTLGFFSRKPNYGKVTFDNGNSLEGYWEKEGVKGSGKFITADDESIIEFGPKTRVIGENIEGPFKWVDVKKGFDLSVNDKRVLEGPYKWTLSDGRVLEGLVVDGQLQGPVKFTRDGNRFEGTYAEKKLIGPGKLIYANGDLLEMKFVDGQIDSVVKFTEKSGAVYEGKLEKNSAYTEPSKDIPTGWISTQDKKIPIYLPFKMYMM